MSDSIELVQSIIDVDREHTCAFLVRNQSELPSSKTGAILKKDEEILKFRKKVFKYSYEFDILVYGFDVKAYKLEVEELRKQHKD